MSKQKALHSNYFLDYQSTTPTDPDVLNIMNIVSRDFFANPHSAHGLGRASNDLIEQSISLIQQNLGSEDYKHIFTSGATESNNLFIRGLKDHLLKHRLKAVTVKTEHKCVLNSFHYLEKEGVEVQYIDVQTNGLIDLDYLSGQLENVGLLSIMMVNNEIGTIQPIKEISNLVKPKGIIFHSDIAQAMGRLPINLNDLGLDAVSISGHKFYGPKGVGLLIISDFIKDLVKPLILGGGQQDNLRSGTLPTPLCVGIARAIDLYQQMDFLIHQHHSQYSLWTNLFALVRERYNFTINGIEATEDITNTKRIAANLNICFENFEAFTLLNNLSEFHLSTGSACSSGEFDYSHVLRALKLPDEILKGSIRISQGHSSANAIINLRNKLVTLHKPSLKMPPAKDSGAQLSDLFLKRNRKPKHQLYKTLKYRYT